MPIAYSCPHCGKQFSVPEQYAGQTGPCAACGKPITIPTAYGAPPSTFAPPSAVSTGMGIGAILAIVAVVGLIVLVMCGGVGAALLLPAVQAAREAARRAQSTNNLRQIAIAIHNYHDTYGSFPPAVVNDANGKPLYSGRVLLLPFLEQQSQSVYEQFNKDQAWDSPENLAISQTRLKIFSDPSSLNPPSGQTDYLFVTGAGTIFEAGKNIRMSDITDGTSNTLMLVEVKGSGINWAQPRDLDISMTMSLPPGNHPRGNNAVLADGSARFLSSKDVSPEQIRAAATRNGGEPDTGL
jgi:hypothetical protein